MCMYALVLVYGMWGIALFAERSLRWCACVMSLRVWSTVRARERGTSFHYLCMGAFP
jgi:hypothetical protein